VFDLRLWDIVMEGPECKMFECIKELLLIPLMKEFHNRVVVDEELDHVVLF
jgi:hypothetical protein